VYRWGSRAERLNALLIMGVVSYVLIEALGGQRFHFGAGSISGQVRNVLWFAALCGIASAGTIEILKRVIHVRGVFQEKQLQNWLGARWHGDSSTDEPHLDPFRDLLQALRLRQSEAWRVFDLPTEQLAAQLAAAADTALASPDSYPALLDALAGTGAPRAAMAAAVEAETEAERQASGSAFARGALFEFEQAVRTGVDQFQIAIGERWRSTVQGAALWISGAFGIGLTYASGHADDGGPRYVLAALLLGGPFAWVIRDVAALLERARR
jgi:hypothetical protein